MIPNPLIVSNVGNTAGNTGMTYGTVVLQGSNNITLNQSTNSNGVVTIHISGQNTTAALTNASAFVQSSATIAGTNISGTIASNVISLSVAAAGGGGGTLSYFEPPPRGTTTTQSVANGTVYFQPFMVNNNISMYRIQKMESISLPGAINLSQSFSGSISGGSATSGTGLRNMSNTIMLWSRVSTGTNANSSNIASFYSNSFSHQIAQSASVSWSTNGSSATVSVTMSGAVIYVSSIDSTGGVTMGTGASTISTTFSSTSNGANSFSSSFSYRLLQDLASATRGVNCPFATSLAPGEYWLANIHSTGTSSTNISLQNQITGSQIIVCFQSLSGAYSEYGVSNISTIGTNFQQGWGSYSASSQTSTTIPLSQITQMNNLQTWFNMIAQIK